MSEAITPGHQNTVSGRGSELEAYATVRVNPGVIAPGTLDAAGDETALTCAQAKPGASVRASAASAATRRPDNRAQDVARSVPAYG